MKAIDILFVVGLAGMVISAGLLWLDRQMTLRAEAKQALKDG